MSISTYVSSQHPSLSRHFLPGGKI